MVLIGPYFDHHTATAAVQYVLERLNPKNRTYIPVFKILYFAEKVHLEHYGIYFLGDEISAMENGPVLSGLYDALKAIRLSSPRSTREFKVFADHLNVSGMPPQINIKKRLNPAECLSIAATEVLDRALEKYSHLPASELIEETHKDEAWKHAWETASAEGRRSFPMPPEEIAKQFENANEVIKYIREHT